MKHPEAIILCLDGLFYETLLPHLGTGLLPAFDTLAEQGCTFTDFRSVFPTITPVCWAAFATGAWPSENNITCASMHAAGDHPDSLIPSYRMTDRPAQNLWDCASIAGKRSMVMSIPCSTFDYSSPPADKNLIIVKNSLAETNAIQRLDIRKNEAGSWPDCIHLHFDEDGSEIDAIVYINPAGERLSLTGAYGEITLAPMEMNTLWIEDGAGRRMVRLKADAIGEAGIRLTAVLARDERTYAYPSAFAQAIAPAELPRRYADARLHAGDMLSPQGRRDVLKKIREDYDSLYTIMRHAVCEEQVDLAVQYYEVFDDINHRIENILEGYEGTPELAQDLRAFVKEVLVLTDGYIARTLALCGENTTFVLLSDHGAVGHESTADIHDILEAGGLMAFVGDGEGRTVDWRNTLAYPVGTCHIYVNLAGREPCGIVPESAYEDTCNRVIHALQAGFFDERSGATGLAFAVSKNEAGFVGLGGDFTGDVVYGTRGRYKSRGIHGTQIPTTGSGRGGSIQPVLWMLGKGIRRGESISRPATLCDVTPTLCALHGYPMPNRATGAILHQALLPTR